MLSNPAGVQTVELEGGDIIVGTGLFLRYLLGVHFILCLRIQCDGDSSHGIECAHQDPGKKIKVCDQLLPG